MMHSPSTPQNIESAPLYTFTWFVVTFCAHIQFFFKFSSHIILDLIKYIMARIQFRQEKKDNIIILHICFNGLDHKMRVGPF